MIEELLAALGENPIAFAVAVVVGVAGSTGASAFITEAASSFRATKVFKREVREKAIKITTEARATFMKWGDKTDSDAIDPEREEAITQAESNVHAAVASTGHATTYEKARTFTDLGMKYAAHNEATSREQVTDAFNALMKVLVKKLPG